ncbi:hypothetical protein [Sagittula sp. S175]|uniref:hypothetical protein n=1 Tax=Sagittula sp. S175 TaxID=3415129 RepID=UPI003C7CC3B1
MSALLSIIGGVLILAALYIAGAAIWNREPLGLFIASLPALLGIALIIGALA